MTLKSKVLRTLSKDILIVELPKQSKFQITPTLLAVTLESGEIKLFRGEYKLIGKHDNLDKAVVDTVIQKVMDGQHYQNYNSNGIIDRWAKDEVSSFMSAIDAGILWENPVEKPEHADSDDLDDYLERVYIWDLNERRTFIKDQTLFFANLDKKVLLSLKHSRLEDGVFTFWRDNNAGYCYHLDDAGRYDALEKGYHDSENTMPIRKRLLDTLDRGAVETLVPFTERNLKLLSLEFEGSILKRRNAD